MSVPDYVQTALPLGGVPASGVFTPTKNIVTNTFNTTTGSNDTPFNSVYIGDSSTNLVGSSTTPYLPLALPAYIPTLYKNVYDVQTNLKNAISLSDVPNDREYPTIYAVKQYVATQLTGTEILQPDSNSKKAISTGLSSTFLTTSSITNSLNVTSVTDITTNITSYITSYDINVIDSARNGAEKRCINVSPVGEIDEDTKSFMQIYLSVANQYFLVNGKQYKCYAFSSIGDILNMLQYKDDNGNDIFIVLTYGGLFSETAYYPLPSGF